MSLAVSHLARTLLRSCCMHAVRPACAAGLAQSPVRALSTKKRTRPSGLEDVEIDVDNEMAALEDAASHASVRAAAKRAAGDSAALLPSDGEDALLEEFSSVDEDEDLLSPAQQAVAADKPAGRRKDRWREANFIGRSQAGELGEAENNDDGAWLDDSGRASGSSRSAPAAPVIPAPPQVSMPDLYTHMPQDAVSRVLAAASARAPGSYDADDAELEDEHDGGRGAALPAQGTGVDYCVFCYHGTSFLRPDNTALLTKFISDRGSILPKRFTRCCAKHQRKLAHTIRTSRWLNLLTWHSKPHPKLRFTSLTPKPLGGAAAAGAAPAVDAGAAKAGEAVKIGSAL